jgi:hypothetical protein
MVSLKPQKPTFVNFRLKYLGECEAIFETTFPR